MAEAAELPTTAEPNAVALATVSASGQPSNRMVLLKGYDAAGFTFFTNYDSRKGQELQATQKAALCFYWEPLQRQVRVEGSVEKLSEEESAEYYHSRPRNSQIGAWCSAQSSVISGRQVCHHAPLHVCCCCGCRQSSSFCMQHEALACMVATKCSYRHLVWPVCV